jgi:FdhD protein
MADAHLEAGSVSVLAVRGTSVERRPDSVVGEEPLQVRAAGPGQALVDVAITMRSPGHEEDLAAGFLLSEGLADATTLCGARFRFGDPLLLAQPHDEILVELPVAFDASAVAARNFAATASCGICGRASMDALASWVAPLPPGPVVARSVLVRLPDAMREAQAVFERTGGLHASALFDPSGELVVLREDVGRHNALDKVIGSRALAGALPLHGQVLLVSGRVSFEIVQKAAAAGVPIVAAISAPSDLAVATAERLAMTLVGFLRGDGFNIYTVPERIDLSE